jgi:hypothetical protein
VEQSFGIGGPDADAILENGLSLYDEFIRESGEIT